MGGSSSLERKFSRDVRLHGLRLLRGGYRPGVFSKRKPLLIVDALVDDIWRGLSHAAGRRSGLGRLHGQTWPTRGITTDSLFDVGGNLHDRLHAGIRFDWSLGSPP